MAKKEIGIIKDERLFIICPLIAALRNLSA